MAIVFSKDGYGVDLLRFYEYSELNRRKKSRLAAAKCAALLDWFKLVELVGLVRIVKQYN